MEVELSKNRKSVNAESKCNCQRCGQSIAFPTEMAGQDASCPHCGRETTLLLPQARKADSEPIAQTTVASEQIKESTLICCYVLSVLLPLIGFFCGVYLISKKQGGHGAACMAVSIFSAIVWVAIFSSMD